MKILALAVCISIVSGCASTASIWLENTDENPCERPSHVYRGVQIDSNLICRSFTDNETPTWLSVPGLIDIVPSVIFDTLQLPFTIPATNRNDEACGKYEGSPSA
jgi:uncharacterized protein YceK